MRLQADNRQRCWAMQPNLHELNRPSHHYPGFDFPPSQPRRKSNLADGSAAKVFQPHPQKTKSRTQGGVSSSPSVRQVRFPGIRGCRARLFFGHFLLARQKKVTSCRATPGPQSSPAKPPSITTSPLRQAQDRLRQVQGGRCMRQGHTIPHRTTKMIYVE